MERNLRLDYFRILLSVLVITPHTQPLFEEDSLLGWFMSNGVARIAVPCFFIISGYFVHQKLNDNKALKKYAIHMLVVYLVWSLIYLPTYIDSIEYRSLITFGVMGYYHLWFLPALIIGILLLKCMCRFVRNDKIIVASSIVLFLIGAFLEYPQTLSYRIYCNGVFFGYPFVALGYYMQKMKWEQQNDLRLLIMLLIIGALLLFAQSYQGYLHNVHYNMLIGMYVLCPVLFLLVMRGAKYVANNDYVAKTAAGIYYVHILVATQIIPLADVGNIKKLPAIIVVSVFISVFLVFVNKRVKIFL